VGATRSNDRVAHFPPSTLTSNFPVPFISLPVHFPAVESTIDLMAIPSPGRG